MLLLVIAPGILAADTDPAALQAGEQARAVVADQLALDLPATRVISTQAVVFPDSSLDCPLPGMGYSQVLTPGHRVIVEAEGRRFDVRVAGANARICAGTRASTGPTGAPATGRRDPAGLVDSARISLAGSLGLEPGEIRLLRLRSLRPGESVPGCTLEPVTAGQETAWVIQLGAEGRQYDYVSDGPGIRACPELIGR